MPPTDNIPFDQRLEDVLEEFELAWQGGATPSIPAILERLTTATPREFVIELVLVDMEYRWASASARTFSDVLGAHPGWGDYLDLLPALGDAKDLPVWAVVEHYRTLRAMGIEVDKDQFLANFPDQMPGLVSGLIECDQAIAVDRGVASPPPAQMHHAVVDPRALLAYSDFVLKEHVGTGGTGKVYRAWQKSLARNVAIKSLLKDRQTDPDAVDRFVNESRVIAHLRHPGIVGVQGLGRFPGGGYFLVMDFVEGGDLQQRLRSGPLPVAESVEFAMQVAAAVEYAHGEGIFHCDLKPSNLLVDRTGRIVVADFGMAVLAGPSDASRRAIGGTPAYMAPEQFDGEVGPIGPHTDVYGLGGVLYALLTGQAPRAWSSPRESIRQFFKRPLIPAHELQDVPGPLSELCARCLSARPIDRFDNVAEFTQALRLAGRGT